jgi:hypothetical protein
LNHKLNIEPLFRKLGDSTFVDIKMVKEQSESENWPFRLLKISNKSTSVIGPFLRTEDDHCEYSETLDPEDNMEYWRICLLKNSKKRMRSWV